MASEVKSSGVGFFGLLGIVFIVLKLTSVITWSWWWVTAPLWGPCALVLSILAVIALGAALVCGLGAMFVWFVERTSRTKR